MKIKLSLIIFLMSLPFVVVSQDIEGSFSTEIHTPYTYKFLLHKPDNTKEKKPLIIFLVGDGEKGTDVERVKIHGPFKYLKTHTLDAYVLAPQCPETESFNSETLYRLIVKVQKENNIDSNRIYLTGLSSGGWATWNLALLHPELFAALVPISSYVDLNEQDYACKLKDIPIRIFHGLLDDVVNPYYPISMYKLLKTCNATDVKLTIFDDDNHGCWTRVYDNQEIYDWMFQQVKKQ